MHETFLQDLNKFVSRRTDSNHLITPELKIEFLKERLKILTEIRDKYSTIITFKLSNGLSYTIPDSRFPFDARNLFDEMESINKFFETYKDII